MLVIWFSSTLHLVWNIKVDPFFQEVSGNPQFELLVKEKIYISVYFLLRNLTLKELLESVRKCGLQKHKAYPAAER